MPCYFCSPVSRNSSFAPCCNFFYSELGLFLIFNLRNLASRNTPLLNCKVQWFANCSFGKNWVMGSILIEVTNYPMQKAPIFSIANEIDTSKKIKGFWNKQFFYFQHKNTFFVVKHQPKFSTHSWIFPSTNWSTVEVSLAHIFQSPAPPMPCHGLFYVS